MTVSIAGKEGQASSLPFGISDPQTGLAQPDRPVWVLAAGYPRLAGSSEPGGATTSNRKTFSFGPLKPGATTEAVWKLSAVKAGKFTVLYRIDAGLSGTAKAETNGVAAGGSFATEISAVSAGHRSDRRRRSGRKGEAAPAQRARRIAAAAGG